MWTIQDTFTKFVFPFNMELRDESALETLASSLTAATRDATDTADCSLWVERPFADPDLHNLLPYVKRYIRDAHNHRRFVLDPDLLETLNNLQTSRMSDSEPGFYLSSVDLHLFFNGIGFLVAEIRPVACDASELSTTWIEDLNADLASLGQGNPFWQRDFLPTPGCESRRHALPALLRGEKMTMGQLIHSLLSPLCQRAEGPFSCYEPLVDTFLPVYGAILLRPSEKNVVRPSKQVDEQFQEFVMAHGIVLRKTLPSGNRNRFSRQSLTDPLHHYMPYHNVVHTQSLEGGFVLAYDNGDGGYFSGRQSGAMQSFRTNYFYMMLLALHQRMSILSYTAESADAACHSHPAPRLRKLREDIYDFTARCYFSQASYSEERDQLYRRWQRAFNIGQMYDELKEQVHEIEGYLAQLARDEELATREQELRQEAERTRIISLITLVLLPVSIGAGIIQASPIVAKWLHNGTPVIDALLIIIVTVMISGLAILWLVIQTGRIRTRKRAARE
ncbi:MAG: hypothetical protein OWT28_09545 [Firmicutes bacterium]|nr:hypothetical protein [Bacillota bacterium]